MAERKISPFKTSLKKNIEASDPAPGYPACPDHTEKALLWKLLNAEANTGTRLTENFAMTPPSSVSGFYFGHQDAKYFHVGNIGQDQVVDYANRKGMPLPIAEKWLTPNLDYDPDQGSRPSNNK